MHKDAAKEAVAAHATGQRGYSRRPSHLATQLSRGLVMAAMPVKLTHRRSSVMSEPQLTQPSLRVPHDVSAAGSQPSGARRDRARSAVSPGVRGPGLGARARALTC